MRAQHKWQLAGMLFSTAGLLLSMLLLDHDPQHEAVAYTLMLMNALGLVSNAYLFATRQA